MVDPDERSSGRLGGSALLGVLGLALGLAVALLLRVRFDLLAGGDDDLDLAAGLLDRGDGALRGAVRHDCDLRLEVVAAVAEHAQTVELAAQNAGRDQRLGVDRLGCIDALLVDRPLELAQVDFLVLEAEDVVETALGLNVVAHPLAVMVAVCDAKLYATSDVVGAVGAVDCPAL